MKFTPLNPLNLAAAVIFCLVLITAAVAVNERSDLKDLLSEKIALQSQAYEYDELKKRWSLKESQNVYNTLKTHPNLIKEEKRGKNITMHFDQLSSLEFNRLSNTILNSMLMIKKLTLKRQSSSKGTIIVEFES